MKLTGTCVLGIGGAVEPAAIEFDISAQTITVWRASSPTLKAFFSEPKALFSKHLAITDIRVFSPTATFSCKRLRGAFLSSYTPPGMSVDDGEIDKVLGIDDGRVHAMSLGLALRRSRLSLTVEPLAAGVQLQHEVVLTNHSRYRNESFSVAVGKRLLDVRYSSKHIFITGKLQHGDLEVFIHACSLIGLGSEQVIAQLEPPRLSLNYSWSRTRAYGENVVSPRDLPSSLQSIVTHFLDSDEKTRQRRFHEATHLVEGFRQSIYLEHRLTNILKALESFDETRTMSPNHLAIVLGIEKGDAHFLCGVRNCLIHHGMPLHEAAEKTHADLTSQKVVMNRFARLPVTPRLAWRLHVTFSRLILTAYFRQIGVPRINNLFSRCRGF
jgi:hypothetical protein